MRLYCGLEVALACALCACIKKAWKKTCGCPCHKINYLNYGSE